MIFNLGRIEATIAEDPEFVLQVRGWTSTIEIDVEEDACTLSIVDGKVTGLTAGREPDPTIRLAGSRDQWDRQLAALPEPYWQDPLMGAVLTQGSFAPQDAFRIEADWHQDLFPYYGAIQRLVAILREDRNGPMPAGTVPPVARRFDRAVGRYVYLEVSGVQYRVYFEEAGEGIPLLLQHTAGSDSRQYRHLLEDEDLGRRFRMIAYDLPYHGRSNPPTGTDWWTREYRLSLDFLLEFTVRLIEALELDRPAFLGCSVGGFLAPDLAYYHPGLFRAVVGLNSCVHFGHVGISEMTKSYLDPRLSSEWKAATMRGLTAPGAPEAYRREIGWYYSQGAPPVFQGDLHYYQVEHDLRGKLADIDTSRTAVYIVVGEYDRLRVEAHGARAVADGITGAHYVEVPQAGHFMMAENPATFRPVLVEILDEIEALD
jgi:pimeloyl-ACP methyl ester carboxylesterase